jgi:hypothetical protein
MDFIGIKSIEELLKFAFNEQVTTTIKGNNPTDIPIEVTPALKSTGKKTIKKRDELDRLKWKTQNRPEEDPITTVLTDGPLIGPLKAGPRQGA